MKKLYLTPTTDIINVHTQGLIMGSGGDKAFNDPNDQVDPTPGSTLSRRNDWNDEDEEEDW